MNTKLCIYIFGLSLVILFTSRICNGQTDQPNFIFIVVDDLNDYIEGYTDQPQIETPNVKELAAEGTLFLNAYASAPGCGPSRTSFFSGKDLFYTQVYNNEDYQSKFRDNFTLENNNEEVFTFPQLLKDSAGYFTYAINKLFHNPNENDFDKSVGTPACERTLSWNEMQFFEDSDSLLDVFSAYAFGGGFDWGMIPDSMEYLMEDYMGADTAIAFLNSYADSTANTCGRPFFMGLGFFRPHSQRYIPEKYYPPYYLEDVYQEPFVIPYNDPVGTFPYNGIVMPPQPDTIYQDYFDLPEDGIGQFFADNGKVYDQITDYVAGLSPLPEIEAGLSDAQREAILFESVNANYNINYIAAVQFIDAQIGRVLDALNEHPELKENTIVILISDNGYSLGEKRHWTKWSLWEPDIRIPFIIVDPSLPGNQISNATVSLIDLFPTICEMAGLNFPLFSDSSNYLDGHSLIPILNQPEIELESPALSSYKKNTSMGSCYPHYSIRNKRFHYIRYRENNDGTFATTFCDSSYFGYQEELYEIGVNRETDPFEWNNLVNNDDYKPVINYLRQWIPDSALYLQKTLKPEIYNNALSCIAAHNDTLQLSFDLYDTDGILITAPDSYIYKWSNNLTEDIYYGTEYNFEMQLISDIDFSTNYRVMVYLEIMDTIQNITAGLDLKYFFINNIFDPEVTFTLMNNVGLEVCIQDYEITGLYTDTWWDFGDGNTSEDFIPGNYTYATTGTYIVTNYVEYGNDICVKVFSETINLSVPEMPEHAVAFYPNPANEQLNISFPAQLDYAILTVYDITGKRVDSEQFLSSTCTFSCSLNVANYKPGMYVFLLQSGDNRYQATFLVNH